MNRNLSSEQFGRYAQSITKMGSMPRSQKFDDPQPRPIDNTENQFAANRAVPLANPGYF